MIDNLGDRMKSYYENRSKTFLTRRTPVIIRLDGKAFHTFTKGNLTYSVDGSHYYGNCKVEKVYDN